MSRPTTASPPSDLVEQAHADPAGFRRRSRQLALDRANDPAALVELRWALGLAHRLCDDLRAAREELERGFDEAVALGETTLAARIRSSLALVLLHLGQTELALEATQLAAPALEGKDAARNTMQRGLILQRLGRHQDAVAAYSESIPLLEAAEDVPALARLLGNRGILRAYRGELGRAQTDLERSLELARQSGASRSVAAALQNLGFVSGRQGRIPEALALMEEASQLFDELDEGATLGTVQADRAELLADAGLLDEAIERAEAAVDLLADDAIRGGEARLLLARQLLLAGHTSRAAAIADELVDRFRSAGRVGWELHARYVAIAARDGSKIRRGGAGRTDAGEVERLAAELDDGGWMTEARATRLLAARAALRDGATDKALQLLQQVRGVRRRTPALQLGQHWYATALARVATGERRAARRAVTAGLDVLDRSRLAFGSAELRAHAAAHTVDLVELAVRLALEDGRPVEALRVLDRVRATDVAVRVRPPDDERVAADLAELRQLTEQERETAHAGGDVAPLVAARAAVERRLRDRSRTLAAAAEGEASSAGLDVRALRLDVAALRRGLGGRTLLAYLHLDGQLHAIEVRARSTRHHVLGSADHVRTEVAHLRGALRRLAYGDGTAAALEAADRSRQRSVDELRRLVGLNRVDGDVVVVPTWLLDGLPWSALVGPRQGVPTVAPSAGAWLAAARRPVRRETMLLAAGPDLHGADEEVLQLADRHRGSRVLRGSDASTGAVLDGLRTAHVAHLAAHGRFRTDNPLFTSLRFADGLLTVYELESLDQVPDLFVLPCCEAAATATVRGDAVLGLSSTLLRLGARTVVAPIVEIPDEAATPLMLAFHAALASGATPQEALTSALAATTDGSPAARAAAAAFVVVGG